MNDFKKKALFELDKEQLIYLICEMEHSLAIIGEVCVEESKQHIESDKAVDYIRKNIYRMPSLYRVEEAKAFIDMKLGKITTQDYFEAIGLN